MTTHIKDLKRFMTSQQIYAGVRVALAILVPSAILAYYGLLKEYFLFPLGAVFTAFTDSAGAYIRRRNALILAVVCFFSATTAATIFRLYPPLIYVGLAVLGVFFTMLGVYGQRMASVGGFTLVAFSIFIDGQLSAQAPIKSIFIYTAGSFWFLLVFLVSFKLQPYKLIGQMVGENYLQLASYFRIKAKFYAKNPNYEAINKEEIAQQIVIKNLQENTREAVFKTRMIVTEATTTSRLMMLLFMNSIDLFDKMMTGTDYKKIQEIFGEKHSILAHIEQYIEFLSDELTKIGVALQSGDKNVEAGNIAERFDALYQEYFELRSREMSSQSLEDFMNLRFVLLRISEITNEVKTIYKIYNQDLKSVKSLSTGLDFEKFAPKQEQLNLKVFLSNFSLKSTQFRHAIRISIALLLGYGISQLSFLGIGHSYWILIAILAIMRPAYSITKNRNKKRMYGTFFGTLVAYILLLITDDERILLGVFLVSMVLCFALIFKKYSWAIFFMTIYVFIGFDFLNPGNVDVIFRDRLIDTIIAGAISFGVSYWVLPIWEHMHSVDFMKKSAKANLDYFEEIMDNFYQQCSPKEDFDAKRKNAIISLANLSDNFQKMISDPKDKQDKLTIVHQFVNTSHLITAYLASLARHIHSEKTYEEIDWENWKLKISSELKQTLNILHQENLYEINTQEIVPRNEIEQMIERRKKEIDGKAVFDIRDATHITKLTELKNLAVILELLLDVVKEQKRVIKKM